MIFYLKSIENSVLRKSIKNVKLLIGLVVLVPYLVNAQNNSQSKVSLDLTEASLLEVINQLEQQSTYNFSYSNDVAEDNQRNDVSFTNSNVEEILNNISGIYGFDFQIDGEKIVLKKLEQEEVKGKVNDGEINGPLMGATVWVKGGKTGTITDSEGNFSFQAYSNSILTISYVGYTPTEVRVDQIPADGVTLTSNLHGLDEVVVIGYGTDTKEKFNGAVSKIDSKVIRNYSSANFEQSMAGTMSGVQVLSNSKSPGDNSVIQIRGINTLTAGTEPLIVVDGNPLTEGSSFSSISPNDIESINVLKDAASAAIYGSRASNGVILITTKKGEEGDLKVTYDGYVGMQHRIDKFELVDAYDYARFDYDARNYGYISGGSGRYITDDNETRDANGGGKRSRIQPFLQDYLDGKPGLTNSDWSDAAFRNAIQHNHHINLSGGKNKTNYSVSFGYLDQDNIVEFSDYRRLTNNINLNSKISEKVRFGISTNVSLADANPTGEVAWLRSRLGEKQQADPSFATILSQPYYPIYNPDGSYALAVQLDANNDYWDGPIGENVIAQADMTDFTRSEFRVFGNTYLEIEPITNLVYKASFGGDFNSGVEQYFGPSTLGDYRTPTANNPTQAHKYDRTRENFIIENILTYKKSIEKHSFDALLGYSYQQEVRTKTEQESKDFPDDNIRNIGGATSISTEFFSWKWALESYFSRLQYNYDNRYFLSGSFRMDGSSRFGANTKYGNFASVSAGWIVSNEAFFPENNVVSFTKLRASWGQTGNNQIGDYGAIAIIEDDNYVIDGDLTAGSYTGSAPNPDLSWETNTALNFGLDLGFMDNKLLFTAEYFISNTTDLLLEVPVPQQSGFSESLQNIGELKNTGLELELKGQGYKVGKLNIGFNLNFTKIENEVVALGNDQEQIIYNSQVDFITKVGHPIAQFYNYEVIGVYRNQAQIDNDPVTPLAGTEVGDYMVLDANGDGKITSDDRVMQGDYNPDFTYGFGFNLEFKGFDLSAQFSGVEGRKVSDRMVFYAESGEGFFVPTQHYYDNYFNERNPDGFFRRPDFSSFSSAGRLTRKSSLAVYDADYFRLRSLQIGYTFPKHIVDKLGLEGLRVYFTGNNIFNITKYRGYNSDGLDIRENKRQTLSRGNIHTASPLTRFLAFGVNLKI